MTSAPPRSLQDIPDWCTVVITLPTGMEPDGRLSFIKQLKSAGKAVNFTAQTGTPLNNWIARRFEANGKRIDRDAVDRLVFLSGDLMNRLIPEIAKICGYVPGDRVTAQDVEKLAHHIPEANAFQMTEEIARRNYDGAAAKLAELFCRGRRAVEIMGVIRLAGAAALCREDRREERARRAVSYGDPRHVERVPRAEDRRNRGKVFASGAYERRAPVRGVRHEARAKTARSQTPRRSRNF